MLDLLRSLQKEKGFTILLVSHHPEDARYASTRTAFLENGRILAVGRTGELLSRTDLPEFTAYLGNLDG